MSERTAGKYEQAGKLPSQMKKLRTHRTRDDPFVGDWPWVEALIHEEFGDGIMSAIDFKMDLTREADPKGDRVNIVMSGKFLPYKTY